MAKQLQLRRGTSAEHSTFIGALGEVTMDTTRNILRVHDGLTPGGFPSQKQLISGTNIKTINNTSLLGSGDISIIQSTTSVANIDEMKDFVAPYDNYALNVLGYSEAGDGGGGLFYYDVNSTEDDNGGTIIEPTSGSGRWIRVYDFVKLEYFGIESPDYVLDSNWTWDATIDKSTANLGTIIDPSVSLDEQGTGSGLGCMVRQYEGAVNVKWFGIIGESILNATKLQYILNTFTEIDIYDNFTILNNVTVSNKDRIIINGNSNVITFKYLQESAHSGIYYGALQFDDCSNIAINNLTITYDGMNGTYAFPTNSYNGSWNGIMFKNTTNKAGYSLNNVEVSAFNYSGVLFYAPTSSTPSTYLYTRIMISECTFYYNRSSGIRHEGTYNFTMINSSCNSNGKLGDYGTGYGISGGINTRTDGTIISNCIFDNNIRKGIDFHSVSSDIVISGNIIKGNTLYGVYTDNDIDCTVIDNNIIDITIPVDYTDQFATALFLGSYYNTESYSNNNSVIVSNNKIKFNNLSTTAQRVFVMCNAGLSHSFKFSDNDIYVSGNTALFANEYEPEAAVYYDLILSNNKIIIGGNQYQNSINNVNYLSLRDNIIKVTGEVGHIKPGLFRGNMNKIELLNNDITTDTSFNYIYDYATAVVKSLNTRMNNLPRPTGKSYQDIICTGSFTIDGSGSVVQSGNSYFNVASVTKVQTGVFDVALSSSTVGDYTAYPVFSTVGLNVSSDFAQVFTRFISQNTFRIAVFNPAGLAYIDPASCNFTVLG